MEGVPARGQGAELDCSNDTCAAKLKLVPQVITYAFLQHEHFRACKNAEIYRHLSCGKSHISCIFTGLKCSWTDDISQLNREKVICQNIETISGYTALHLPPITSIKRQKKCHTQAF